MPNDPYAVLGVAHDASPAEIAEAYRALAQIYHPDRYASAPARVQAEAHTRMQALNAAFAAVQATGVSRRATAAPRREPEAAQQPPAPPATVHYVDGSKVFHGGDVAPLGFGLHADDVQPVADARRCSRLDRELRAWFGLQRRNASVPAKQMYTSWTDTEQAAYSAKLGCSQISPVKARSFGVSCPECRP